MDHVFDTVTLEDLERMKNMTSMESAAITSFFNDSKGRLRQFFGKAEGFMAKVDLPFIGISKVDGSALARAIRLNSYVAVAERDVVVPAGFVGQWLPYATALAEASSCIPALHKAISNFTNTLGQIINDPSLLKAASGLPYQAPEGFGLHARVTSMNNTYFDHKVGKIQRKLSAVLERASDLDGVSSGLNTALAADKANPPTNVTKGIEKIMLLSPKIISLVEADSGISKTVREQLINLIYELARDVEAYGVYLSMLRAFKLSLDESLKNLK